VAVSPGLPLIFPTCVTLLAPPQFMSLCLIPEYLIPDYQSPISILEYQISNIASLIPNLPSPISNPSCSLLNFVVIIMIAA